MIILLIIKENIEALTFQYHELILEISISCLKGKIYSRTEHPFPLLFRVLGNLLLLLSCSGRFN